MGRWPERLPVSFVSVAHTPDETYSEKRDERDEMKRHVALRCLRPPCHPCPGRYIEYLWSSCRLSLIGLGSENGVKSWECSVPSVARSHRWVIRLPAAARPSTSAASAGRSPASAGGPSHPT